MNLYPCAYSMTFNVTQKKERGQADPECHFKPAFPGRTGSNNNWNVVQYAVLAYAGTGLRYERGRAGACHCGCHIYDRHVDAIKELICEGLSRHRSLAEPGDRLLSVPPDFYQFTPDDVKLEGYQTGEQIRIFRWRCAI